MSTFIITSEQLERLIDGIEHDTQRKIDRVVALGTNLPEVVRCRDCAAFLENATPNDREYPHFCTLHGTDLAEPDGYCAWGERRTDL